LPEAPATGLVEVGRSMVKPEECDEKGEFLPRHYFGRYSDGAPFLWNHLGFDRAAMQERQEGSVVVEMRNEHHGALRAGDLAIVLSGLASFTDKILTFSHFLFEAETGTLVACAEAVGVKFDQKIRKIMRFTDEDRARLEQRKLQFA
jgi:acyl-CoA thioester hydrolase